MTQYKLFHTFFLLLPLCLAVPIDNFVVILIIFDISAFNIFCEFLITTFYQAFASFVGINCLVWWMFNLIAAFAILLPASVEVLMFFNKKVNTNANRI